MKPAILIYLCILLFLFSGCQQAPDISQDIIIGQAGAPISSAEITKVGFVSNIPDSAGGEPAWLETADGSSRLYSCCAVSGIGDTATNLQVYWSLPDGTSTQVATVAVNRDMYFFSEQDIMNSGTYTVHWRLYGKDEVSSSFYHP